MSIKEILLMAEKLINSGDFFLGSGRMKDHDKGLSG
jgi:hypothetical protein